MRRFIAKGITYLNIALLVVAAIAFTHIHYRANPDGVTSAEASEHKPCRLCDLSAHVTTSLPAASCQVADPPALEDQAPLACGEVRQDTLYQVPQSRAPPIK